MAAEDVVNEFIAAIERKDVDAAVALCAPDISYENMPMQPISGAEAVGKTLGQFIGIANEVDWPIVRQHAVGNVVMNERLDRFQIGDGWLEMPVAGFFEVNDEGLITLWRVYFDMATYQGQLAKLTGGS